MPAAVIGGASDPQVHNGYSYALNNPLRYVDPQGTCPRPGACGGEMIYGTDGRPGMSANSSNVELHGESYSPMAGSSGSSIDGPTAKPVDGGWSNSGGYQTVEWGENWWNGGQVTITSWSGGGSAGTASQSAVVAGQSVPVLPENAVVGPALQEAGVVAFLARAVQLLLRSTFVATRLPWLAGPGAVAANKFATDPSRAALIQRLVASDGSLRVSNTVAQRMATPGRYVPNDAILRAVGSGTRGVDPQGVAGHFMYRGPGLSPHGNPGTVEVLVNEQIGVINHVLFRSGPK